MAKNNTAFRVALILLAAIVVLAGIVIYSGLRNDDKGYPDFTKAVNITSKYSNLEVNVKLNPDHTCEYKVSNDNYPYKGEWKTTEEGKAIKIDINVAHDASLNDNKTVKGTILIYDSKEGKSLAAIPFDAMNMQGAQIYGKWSQ